MERQRSEKNEGGGFSRRREVRIDGRRRIGEAIGASTAVGGKKWWGREGGGRGGACLPGGRKELHSCEWGLK